MTVPGFAGLRFDEDSDGELIDIGGEKVWRFGEFRYIERKCPQCGAEMIVKMTAIDRASFVCTGRCHG